MNRFDVDSPSQQAEKTVNEHYHELQAEVTTTVRHRLLARKMRLDESDLEEAYCQAWNGVCESIKQGKPVSNLTGMLVEITWRRAVDTYRELRPGQRAELDVEEPTIDLDLDAQLDDRIKFKRFITQVRSRLNPRECEAVSLCVIHGYPRAEAAKLMGLKRRQIEKLMDSATKKIGGIITGIAARGCGSEEWARLMRSYALGLIAEDDRDYPRAAQHVAQCAACNRYVNGLRGLSAVLPPALPIGPLLPVGHNSGILSHLERIVRAASHTTGRITGAEGALRSGATTSREAARNLTGMLGTATIAKGVAVIVAGTAALTLATHDHKNHRRVRHPRTAVAHTQVPSSVTITTKPLTFLRSPSGTSASGGATRAQRYPRMRRTRAVNMSRHPPQSSRRYPTHTRTIAGDNAASIQAPATPAPPVKANANAAVNREFGWER